ACEEIVKVLNRNIGPASVWDALFLRAGELIMQQPGLIGIHCVTSINALHFGYQASANDETRRMSMLQGAAFLPLFHKRMAGPKLNSSLLVDQVEAAPVKARGAGAIEEVLGEITSNRLTAARKTLA